VVGLVVDAVSEVMHVLGNDIDESPNVITSYNGDYIMGMAKVAGGIKILLDVDRLNLGTDFTQLESAT
jgi:purine-binding chemotaxis protein CheW